MHPGMVKKVMEQFGSDIILCAGGGIHAHPMGTRAGAMAMRQAIDGVLQGHTIEQTAQQFKELGKAVEAWGIVKD